jgi:hypothetical protein
MAEQRARAVGALLSPGFHRGGAFIRLDDELLHTMNSYTRGSMWNRSHSCAGQFCLSAHSVFSAF